MHQMMHGHSMHRHWSEPYMRSWNSSDGSRIVAIHMWPMVFIGWVLFMLGVMVGVKKSMTMCQMGEGPMGGGMMGKGMMGHGMMGHGGPGKMWKMRMMHGPAHMMHHHHHGAAQSECCCEPEQEQQEQQSGE